MMAIDGGRLPVVFDGTVVAINGQSVSKIRSLESSEWEDGSCGPINTRTASSRDLSRADKKRRSMKVIEICIKAATNFSRRIKCNQSFHSCMMFFSEILPHRPSLLSFARPRDGVEEAFYTFHTTGGLSVKVPVSALIAGCNSLAGHRLRLSCRPESLLSSDLGTSALNISRVALDHKNTPSGSSEGCFCEFLFAHYVVS